MGTRLTVFDQKGRIGKTTTVLNLGAALAKRAKLPFGVGFVAAVDHEVLDDQAMPRADAEAEFRRI